MNNYLNYLVGRVRRKNHNAVDQEVALFLQSEFQYPWYSETVQKQSNNMT